MRKINRETVVGYLWVYVGVLNLLVAKWAPNPYVCVVVGIVGVVFGCLIVWTADETEVDK